MADNSNFESNEESKKEQISLIRTIFINLLISIFIIMCYFYIAEYLGSISTIFIKNTEFVIILVVPLLMFTFFSTLAGKYHGFIAGFIGEFLYQLAYYNTIYIHWCFIIAIWGFISGIWKYKPLKYQNLRNLGYLFMILFSSSLFTMFLIIIFQQILYSGHLESVVINYGLKFFIQAVIVVVLVPLLVFLYDKVLATNEKHIYHLLLAHHPISEKDHTIYFKFGRTYIYLCSRCSGVILGGIIAYFSTHLVKVIYNIIITPELAVFFCIILPIPGMIDWGSQRLMVRRSKTESRVFTGFIVGSALHLMSFARKYYFFIVFLVIFYFSIVGIILFIGYRRGYGQK